MFTIAGDAADTFDFFRFFPSARKKFSAVRAVSDQSWIYRVRCVLRTLNPVPSFGHASCGTVNQLRAFVSLGLGVLTESEDLGAVDRVGFFPLSTPRCSAKCPIF